MPATALNAPVRGYGELIARRLTIAGAVRDGFRSSHAPIAKWTIKHFHFPQHEQELMGNFRLKAKF